MDKEKLEFNTIEKVCLKCGALSLEANEYMTSFSFIVQDGDRRISLGDIERYMIGHRIEEQLFNLILSLDVQCSITQKECNIMGEGFYVGKGKDRLEAIFEFLNDNWYVHGEKFEKFKNEFKNKVKTILQEGL